ncbi:MAG: hypothetical protein KAS30_01410, partial [Candidatus Diapherotrites archaeon]|nr:hypothetical protein [Candidatus Diapherotrites archaeon]
ITTQQNEKYEASGAAVVSVVAELKYYLTLTIPTDRKAEFEAATEEKKIIFSEISKACFSSENLDKDFLTAWAEEYNKIY